MKKIMLAISIFSLLGASQADAVTYNPFLTNGGVASASVTSNSVSYDVYNKALAADDWNAAHGGYTFDTSATGTQYYKYSGYYLGTFGGKGNAANLLETNLENLASLYLGVTYNQTYSSSDDVSSLITFSYLDNSSSTNDHGTWSAPSSFMVSFYGVKSGNNFALYLLDPAADSGYWSTIHLPTKNGDIAPTLSHLAVDGSRTNPVPEPATMLLIGTGIAGLAAVGRRKRS